MRSVYFVLLTVLLPVVACRAQNEDQSEAAIASKMTELAGDTAIRCGLVRGKQNFDVAWACARQADAEQKPFWLALRLMRTDSDVWEGIARDGRGFDIRSFIQATKTVNRNSNQT